ncbi:MAG: nitrous oxide reductase accessory protein NosL [Proteobacteria bacterium]|nr:nitrous oxide reductase accessory protein NosL [Pseudomonadota bacterium]
MKIKTIMALIIVIILFPVIFVQASERCIMCGMDALKSETKFIIEITEGKKEISAGKYSLCCLHCLVILKARIPGGKIGSILARDYDTVTGQYDSGKMIDAKNAFYLVESNARPKGSMVPFMLIFSSESTAEKYKKVYGGKIFNWTDIWKYTESIQ